ncbi:MULTISPECIES: hypothetical protein [unclassified Rothia (in: high G+C Gram-positive bacteria)]|uniref:hypothetical protein n=1 Tax=unclassified Rothia (in: high G+C Gram-positive bacteria) TaxID=2689056 RepID=UPI001957B89D|nr:MULTISPECIES: hypothetical protein [unclassified Rothia (in: high G+C Gram-positive bacteria)]MBM7050967.1 hypothetical protein [Rothia sp. ZJ1223]QRZ62302.1 hypothetical protein JR346_04155 [Rothia sp. ZJ932]
MSSLKTRGELMAFDAHPGIRQRWRYSARYTLQRFRLLSDALGGQFMAFVVLMRLVPPMLSLSLLIGVAEQTSEVSVGGFAAGIVALTYAAMMPVYSVLAQRFGHARLLLCTGIANIPAMSLLSWQLVEIAAQAPTTVNATGILIAASVAGATIPPMSSMMRSYWSREYKRTRDRKMLNSTIAFESLFEVATLPVAAVVTGLIALLIGPMYCLFALIIINMLGMLFVVSRVNKPLFPAVSAQGFRTYSAVGKVPSSRDFTWLPLLGTACVGVIVGSAQSSLASLTLGSDSIEQLGFYVAVMGLASAFAGGFLLFGRVRVAGWNSWLVSGAVLIALTMLLSIPVTGFGVVLTMVGLGVGTGAATVCMESVTTSASLRGYLDRALTSSQATLTAGLALGLVWGAILSETYGYQVGMLIPVVAATTYFVVGHIFGFYWRRSYEEHLESTF